MGLYVVINDAIRIMVPRDLHIGSEEFDGIEIGDKIQIEIKKSRFQVNDTHILSIGQYIGSSASASQGNASASADAADATAADAEGPSGLEAEAEATAEGSDEEEVATE
jgi:hypothetical protein